MNWRVALSQTTLDTAEIDVVVEVLRSGWLSAGPITQAFEHDFAVAHGITDAVAVSSGTAALHLAALALELGPGDEVIMPSLSFVASAAMIALTGARPVFAEVTGPHNLTIDPTDVARRITPRTKAIIVMHYGGYSADMAALVPLARRYGLAMIEDAAHAPLVQTTAGMLGTIGDIGCFSFFATKNMTTGEGGMVVARDTALREKIRRLRSHCMTTSSWDKHQGRPSAYDVVGLGLNYRPTELSSAIGRVQLAKLPADNDRRLAIADAYRTLLADVPMIELPFAGQNGMSCHHLFPILLPVGLPRDDFQARLQAIGVQTSVHYPPNHLFSYYREQFGYRPGSLPISEAAAAREVSLPMHARLTEDDVQLVAHGVRTALHG